MSVEIWYYEEIITISLPYDTVWDGMQKLWIKHIYILWDFFVSRVMRVKLFEMLYFFLYMSYFQWFKRLINPTYKVQKSNRPIAKRYPTEKFKRDIGLRFTNFGSDMVKNRRANFYLFGLRHSLLMDLGHTQQQHPTVHSEGVSRGRVPGCGCWR